MIMQIARSAGLTRGGAARAPALRPPPWAPGAPRAEAVGRGRGTWAAGRGAAEAAPDPSEQRAELAPAPDKPPRAKAATAAPKPPRAEAAPAAPKPPRAKEAAAPKQPRAEAAPATPEPPRAKAPAPPDESAGAAAGGDAAGGAVRAARGRSTEARRASSGGDVGMPATATSMVAAIWHNHFAGSERKLQERGAEQGAEAAEAGVAPDAALAAVAPSVSWLDTGSAPDDEGRQLHAAAQASPWRLEVGQVVCLPPPGGRGGVAAPAFGLLQAMWAEPGGACMAQLRVLLRGADTLLGDAAAEAELFVGDKFATHPLAALAAAGGPVEAIRLARPVRGAWSARAEHRRSDELLGAANAVARAEGRPLRYFYRHRYDPELCAFTALPPDEAMGFGAITPPPPPPPPRAPTALADGAGFVAAGVEHRLGDLLYVTPEVFQLAGADGADGAGSAGSAGSAPDASDASAVDSSSEGEGAPQAGGGGAAGAGGARQPGFAHKGSLDGVRPWALARLLEVAAEGPRLRLRLERFYRPEDVSAELGAASDPWEAYAPPPSRAGAASARWVAWAGADAVRGAATAVPAGTPAAAAGAWAAHGWQGPPDVFEVVGTFDPVSGETGPPPPEFAATDADAAAAAAAAVAPPPPAPRPLACLDIFAGCGGLSEGLHQAGVAETRWAIEYEPAAAQNRAPPAPQAFTVNHPGAKVATADCRALLLAAMRKAGASAAADCVAGPEAATAADALPPRDVDALPAPGEVITFLSYADYYRPRYFLLENVTGFALHEGSLTLRLTLRSLLDMGYQVRLGTLNSGHYGAPQSRRRVFVFAAAPGEALPAWPAPRHAFRCGARAQARARARRHLPPAAAGAPRGPRPRPTADRRRAAAAGRRRSTPTLAINLPNSRAPARVRYEPFSHRERGGSLRPVTVGDALSDLPPVGNDHAAREMPYGAAPRTAYQRALRRGAAELTDHVPFMLNVDDLERVSLIPKDTPGADWRALAAIEENEPGRTTVNVRARAPRPPARAAGPQPAGRRPRPVLRRARACAAQGRPLRPPSMSGPRWYGCYARVDAGGMFQTITTAPRPGAKMGMVLHPSQDRVLTVRECARAQGFPDAYRFAGSVADRYRQGAPMAEEAGGPAPTQEQLAAADADFAKALSLRDADPEAAIELLAGVLEVRNRAFGEQAIECAETYLHYGMLLFEQAQAASDYFGEQVKDAAMQRARRMAAGQPGGEGGDGGEDGSSSGEDEGSEEEEEENGGADEPMGEAEREGADAAVAGEEQQQPGAAAAADGAAAEEEGPSGSGSEDGVDGEPCDGDAAGGEGGGAEEGGAEEGGAEEVTGENDDMALAWEMLEMARLIYTRHGGAAAHPAALADAHGCIGDIFAEQEKFEEAVPEYDAALAALDAAPGGQAGARRHAAELAFKKANALQLAERPAEALGAMRAARAHLTARLHELNAALAAAAAAAAGGGGGTAAAAAADAPTAAAFAAFASVLTTYAKPAEPASAGDAAGAAAPEPAAAAAAEAAAADVAKKQREAADLRGVLEGVDDRIEELGAAVQADEEVKQSLRSALAALAGGGGGAPGAGSSGAAAAAGGAVETIGFGAPSGGLPAAAAAPVRDIGVIGRGRRAAPTPVAAPAVAAAGEGGGGEGGGGKKRALSDLVSSDQEVSPSAGGDDSAGGAKPAPAAAAPDAAPKKARA
ncbi:MET1B [Scenedesmus sp. PABB004]|nr:MET1B [Scenedesmus sp. PABB004]